MIRIVAALATIAPLGAMAQQSAPAQAAPPSWETTPPSQPAPPAGAANAAPVPAPAQAPVPVQTPPTAAPAQPAASPPATYVPPAPPKQRGSWYIGFGLGSGDGNIKLNDGSSGSFKEFLGASPTNVSLNFKVGATLNPTMLLGFDVTTLLSSTDEGGVSRSIQVVNYDAMFTWFPVEKGFFLRGGAGSRRRSWI